jgi:hypothetical protein
VEFRGSYRSMVDRGKKVSAASYLPIAPLSIRVEDCNNVFHGADYELSALENMEDSSPG